MAVDFLKSETRKNLMRAFAGESQARNRYTYGAEQARKQNLYVVAEAFTFTANQEREHGKIFYNLLKESSGKNVEIEGSYPVDLSDSIAELLRCAQHNEYEEHDPVYKTFGNVAKEEGFNKIATAFYQIAAIEKTHGDRFGSLAELLEQNKLFKNDVECAWMCLNCGYIYEGKNVPEKCPVCNYDQGYFIRLEYAPYTRK